MEKRIVLTKRNAHRAAVVQNIEHPEWGTWAFHYKEQKLMEGRYADVIGMGCNSKVLHEGEYAQWEIVSYKYPVLLEEFDEAAYRAFYWTSFRPDERGIRTIASYEEQLNGDLKDMPENEKEQYIANYKKYFRAWLSAHGNCASSAITGGSGFNTRRAEKANNREHAAMGRFIEWREKALKAIAKRVEAARPEEEKRAEDWQRLEKSILRSAATIVGINEGREPYHKQLFVSSIYNKVETYAKKGETEIVAKALELIRTLNQKSSIITERHKFFKLGEVAEAAKAKAVELEAKEDADYTFDGGVVRLNYAEERLQILFDEKPAPDMIGTLKSRAFRWSPRFGAWQRQLTENAKYVVIHHLNLPNLTLK